MQSDCANVRSLIAAVVPLVKRCSKMTSNDVRSAMYGFQGMYSSSKEVNDLIAAFAGEQQLISVRHNFFVLF